MTAYMVEIAVNNVETVRAWLRDALGMCEVQFDRTGPFGLYESYGLRLAVVERPVAGTPVNLVFEVPDLSAAIDNLRSLGQAVEGPIFLPAENYWKAWAPGPDGLKVTVFQWAEPSFNSSTTG